MDADLDGNAVVDIGAYEFQVLTVAISIKPGSGNQFINLKSGGLLPVAVLTAESFDASTVKPAAVRFAGTRPVRHMLRDVDGDGDADLLLSFERKRLELEAGSTSVLLTGKTKNKVLFSAVAKVEILTEQ